MNEKITQTKSYQEKQQILKSIFSEYVKAKTSIENYPSRPLIVREHSFDSYLNEHHLLNEMSKMNDCRELVNFIDHQIHRLSETERLINEHEYINHASKYWWEFYFSSSTYYRHKKKAVEKLFSLLVS